VIILEYWPEPPTLDAILSFVGIPSAVAIDVEIDLGVL
jgi:hypothetical protein